MFRKLAAMDQVKVLKLFIPIATKTTQN